MPSASYTLFLEVSFMKFSHLLLISLLIVGALFVPAVSAEIIIDEEFVAYEYTGGARSSKVSATSSSNNYPIDTIRFADITGHSQVSYIVVEIKNDNKLGYIEEGRTERIYTLGGREDTSFVYVEHLRNPL